MSTEAKRVYDQERYKKNREKVLAQAKIYYANHRDAVILRCRQHDIENPEQLRERGRRWERNHPDKKKAKDLKRRTENPGKYRDYMRKHHLKYVYGITDSDYQAMLISQGGVCAICGGKNNGKALEVDHSHKTGSVRGLLCRSCNTGIGFLKDNPKLAEKAVAYLKRSR